MFFFDIHTHRSPLVPEQSIVSCSVGEHLSFIDYPYMSVGIHPWYLTEADAERQWNDLQEAVKQENVIAIGEVGLDKLTQSPFCLQEDIFRREIALAESYRLPLVIHCVKAFNELLQLKKEMQPHQPWVIHGFRGKMELAEMCLRQGCYLSFGPKFQESALKKVPIDRLLIETDDSMVSIVEIHRRIAEVRGISLEELAECVSKNAREVFFKH